MITGRRLLGHAVRSRVAVLCMLALAAATACGGAVPNAPSGSVHGPIALRDARAARLAGCWALFDHRGRPASDSLDFAPARMRLDTAAAGPGDGRSEPLIRPLVKLGSAGQPLHEAFGLLHWSADSLSDSVHVVFSTGFTGSALTMAPSQNGDTLSGHATRFRDYGPPFDFDAGRVTAVRISCDRTAAP